MNQSFLNWFLVQSYENNLRKNGCNERKLENSKAFFTLLALRPSYQSLGAIIVALGTNEYGKSFIFFPIPVE